MITQKQKVFEFLLKSVNGDRGLVRKEGIVRFLGAELNLVPAIVSKCLADLDDMNLISRGYRDDPHDRRPFITQVELRAAQYPVKEKPLQPPGPAKAAAAEVSGETLEPQVVERATKVNGVLIRSKSDSIEPPPEEQISASAVQVQQVVQTDKEDEKPLIAVLVDFDNAVLRALDAGYTLSFLRLREYVRRYGCPEFVEVFLSPKSDRPEVKSMLWASGYFVIACPMRNKDKDAVDEIMKARARHWAELSDIAKIVIVSEDADFSEGDFPESLRDKGKKVEFVRTSSHRAELEGQNIALRSLEGDVTKKKFSYLLSLMASGKSPTIPEQQKDAKFLEDILRAAIGFFERDRNPRSISFRLIQDRMGKAVLPQWSKVFHPREVVSAVSTMIDQGIIQQQQGNEIVYYELNKNHPLVVRMTSVPRQNTQIASAAAR